ncbi:MAG: translation initiation factor IF-2 [Candidatus Pacebacteria bacterium]|nr:translation initiation factor IF-2 [Candidatus Paceibacterota bacterium]
MNLTELARILKITPQELKDFLPKMGFNIGQKAIKVDNRTAQKIIKVWPRFKRQWEREKLIQEKEEAKTSTELIETKKISVPKLITIREFAAKSDLPINTVLAKLMANGVFASMNEKIDFDTASIIGEDLGVEVSLQESVEGEEKEERKLSDLISAEDQSQLQERAPVIVVMGHVDHGKTRLLDAIRETNVIEGEAGGITQHIGAYQAVKNDRALTFIDTPGHEAFTAMRSRGAKVADIAILVVAADDGVKPQTTEAFKIIEAAKIPFIVAINKIDKPEADVAKTMQDLSSKLNLVPEEWGGKTICVPISAKEKQGLDKLLDMLLLVSDTEVNTLKANPDSKAAGTIIESHIDRSAGPEATILVQNGTLRVGDQLVFNNIIYGKVKALFDYLGQSLESAGPAMPAKVLGLKVLPEVGDMLEVGEGVKAKANQIKFKRSQEQSGQSQESGEDKAKTLNVIIKSDVLGSAEAIEESLLKENTKKIKVKVLTKSLGNINEGDVKRAEDSEAIILGFNVKTTSEVEESIREKNVKVKNFSIIYDLIKYVKDEMKELEEEEIVRREVGKIKVLAIFRTEHKNQIIGGKVIEGQAENDSRVEVLRNDQFEAEGKISQLQSGKQDVFEVEAGAECGLYYEGKPVVEVGDVLNLFKEEVLKEEDNG